MTSGGILCLMHALLHEVHCPQYLQNLQFCVSYLDWFWVSFGEGFVLLKTA
jgi:hypothetical protein